MRTRLSTIVIEIGALALLLTHSVATILARDGNSPLIPSNLEPITLDNASELIPLLDISPVEQGDRVTNLGFTADPFTLVAGYESDAIIIWNVSSSELQAITLSEPHFSGKARKVSTSHGSNLAGSYDGNGRLWNTTSGSEVLQQEQTNPFAISEDGHSIGMWVAKQTPTPEGWLHYSIVQVINWDTGSIISEIPTDGYIHTGSFGRSSNELIFVTGHFSNTNTIQIWDAQTGILRSQHTPPCLDNRWLVSGMNVNTERELVAYFNYERIEIWDLASDSLYWCIASAYGSVFDPADPNFFLYFSVGNSSMTEIADLRTRTNVATLPDAYTAAAFNHDGTLLATGTVDGTITIWGVLSPR